jgi:hypothetical protein
MTAPRVIRDVRAAERRKAVEAALSLRVENFRSEAIFCTDGRPLVSGSPIAAAVNRYATFLSLPTGFGVGWGAFLAFSFAANSCFTLMV